MINITYAIGIMLLTGNLFFLLYLFMCTIFKRIITYNFKSSIIKINLLFFIIPISYFTYAIKLLIFVTNGSSFEETLFFSGGNPTIIFTPYEILINKSYIIFMVFLLIWLILAIIFLVYHLLKYMKFKNYLYSKLIPITDKALITHSEKIKDEYRINKSVTLYNCDILSSACTFGLIKHIVILPRFYSNNDLEIMISHELTHIKQHDPLFRFIRLICLSFYWFNPFMHWISNQYDIISEIACDERVVKNLDFQGKRRYAELILEVSTSSINSANNKYTNYFSKNASFIKERIDCIMTNNHINILKKIVLCTITFSMTSICILPAVAAPTPQMIHLSEYTSSDAIYYDDTSDHLFDFSKGNSFSVISIIYDEQFISETGKISMISPNDNNKKVNCTHSYVKGIYSNHTIKASGCTLKEYNAKQCEKCGTISIGELISTTNYVTCPH